MEYTLKEIKQAWYLNYSRSGNQWFGDSSTTEKELQNILHDRFDDFMFHLDKIIQKKDTWKTDITEYRRLLNEAKIKILTTPEYYNRPLKDFPNLDVRKSLERSIEYFWGTEAGWKLKIKQSKKVKTFNLVTTLLGNIDKNRVYLPFDQQKQQPVSQKPARHITPEVEI